MTRELARANGYSLLELLFVVGIMGVVTSVAVVQISTSNAALKGDGALRVVRSQLTQAQQMAITQRRYMRVTFDTVANQVSVVREDTTATTTTLSTVPFESGAVFALTSGLPDTPDAFGKSAATAFTSTQGTFASASSSTSVVKFAPDGTLVDWNGNLTNGTVFTNVPGQAVSARAVTVLGSTGRVRGYRWNGATWVLM